MYDSYGERAKLAEKNEGVDWKAISHAFRAGYQLRGIYKYGDFTYPLDENSFILDVKQGKLDFKDVSHKLEELMTGLEDLSDNSCLPEKPDVEYWTNWVEKLYIGESNYEH